MPELSGLVVALKGKPASAAHDGHAIGKESARGMAAITDNVSRRRRFRHREDALDEKLSTQTAVVSPRFKCVTSLEG